LLCSIVYYHKDIKKVITRFNVISNNKITDEENKDLEITSNLTDVYPNVLESEEIVLDKKTLSIYLGKTLEDKEVVKILESLERQNIELPKRISEANETTK